MKRSVRSPTSDQSVLKERIIQQTCRILLLAPNVIAAEMTTFASTRYCHPRSRTDAFIVANEDMASNQRIPVSERTRDELREVKAPGQTYDELLQEFIEQKRRERLATDVKAVFERADDLAEVIHALENDEFDRALELMGLNQQEATELTESEIDGETTADADTE